MLLLRYLISLTYFQCHQRLFKFHFFDVNRLHLKLIRIIFPVDFMQKQTIGCRYCHSRQLFTLSVFIRRDV